VAALQTLANTSNNASRNAAAGSTRWKLPMPYMGKSQGMGSNPLLLPFIPRQGAAAQT
jgi:hypothetical protein